MPAKFTGRARTIGKPGRPSRMVTSKYKKGTRLSKHLTLDSRVKAIIEKKEETKYVSTYAQTPDGVSVLHPRGLTTALTTFTSAITSTAEIYAALPQLTQGVGVHQRIGDKVRPVSCRLDVQVFPGAENIGNTFDITVHIWCLTAKAVKYLPNFTAIPITQLLEDGQGGDTSFDGTLQNTQLVLNKNNFHCFRHLQLRFNKSDGYTNGAIDHISSPNRSNATGVLGIYQKSVKVPLPKVLEYDNNGSLYPTNTAPFFCIGWVRNDCGGFSAPSDTGYVPVVARTHMWYKDS
jgi:hypothetical protein